MVTFVLTAALCALPEVVDLQAAQPWEFRDFAAFATAERTCAERYGPRSPCLRKFVRIQIGRYRAICGGV